MITKETLDHLRKHQQKPYYGSKAQSTFKNGVFNPENWNGGDAIIRNWTDWLRYSVDRKIVDEVTIEYQGVEYHIDFIADYTYNEDMNYVTIALDGSIENLKTGHFDNDWYAIVYIKWYKSRGATDLISWNGRPMTEDEYLLLLNIIEKTGYKFDV